MSQIETYEVKRGSPMHHAGWALGWYWELRAAEIHHGPFKTKAEALANAEKATRSLK